MDYIPKNKGVPLFLGIVIEIDSKQAKKRHFGSHAGGRSGHMPVTGINFLI